MDVADREKALMCVFTESIDVMRKVGSDMQWF